MITDLKAIVDAYGDVSFFCYQCRNSKKVGISISISARRLSTGDIGDTFQEALGGAIAIVMPPEAPTVVFDVFGGV